MFNFCSGFDEDDTDGDSLPDLVSADDSDTSVEEDGVKMGKEPEMPELIGDEDSDKSSLDEVGELVSKCIAPYQN